MLSKELQELKQRQGYEEIQHKPKCFTRETNLSKWLVTLEEYAAKHPESNRKKLLMSLLDDDVNELIECATEESSTYEEIKGLMTQSFRPCIKETEQWKQKFQSRTQQANESLHLYHIELIKIAKQAFSHELKEDAIKQKIQIQFVRGLSNSKVRDHIIKDASGQASAQTTNEFLEVYTTESEEFGEGQEQATTTKPFKIPIRLSCCVAKCTETGIVRSLYCNHIICASHDREARSRKGHRCQDCGGAWVSARTAPTTTTNRGAASESRQRAASSLQAWKKTVTRATSGTSTSSSSSSVSTRRSNSSASSTSTKSTRDHRLDTKSNPRL